MKSPDERMAEILWETYLKLIGTRETVSFAPYTGESRDPPLWLSFQVAIIGIAR